MSVSTIVPLVQDLSLAMKSYLQQLVQGLNLWGGDLGLEITIGQFFGDGSNNYVV
jgi:hypothetical protein